MQSKNQFGFLSGGLAAALSLLVLLSSAPLMAATARAQSAPAALIIDDFEQGVTNWITNDINKELGHGEVVLSNVISTAPGAPEGKQRAAIVTFRRAADSWATVSLPISGKEWKAKGIERIAFWFKGDGSDNTVDIALVTASVGGVSSKFIRTLPLINNKWEQLVVSLSEFVEGTTPVTSRLDEIIQFQFSKRGTWNSLFFLVDDLEAFPAAGSTIAASPTKVTPVPSPPIQPQKKPMIKIKAKANFNKTKGFSRLNLGSNLNRDELALLSDTTVSQSVKRLKLHLIRIKVRELVQARLSGLKIVYDFNRLTEAVNLIRDCGSEPLICLTPASDLTATGGNKPKAEQLLLDFPAFCQATVRFLNIQKRKKIHTWELFDEPFQTNSGIPQQKIDPLFKQARTLMIQADSSIKVGGPADASAWQPHLQDFLSHVKPLDYLSYHFYATHNASTTESQLIDTASRTLCADLPYQLSFRALQQMVQRSRAKTRLFVTECSPSSLRDKQGEGADSRLMNLFSGVWLSQLFASSATYVDEIMINRTLGGNWGVMDDKGRAFPMGSVLWLIRTYFPAGSKICEVTTGHPDLVLFAAKTPVSCNLMLIHRSDTNAQTTVTVSGTGRLTSVKMKQIDSTTNKRVESKTLANDMTQEIGLRGYSISVIQYYFQKSRKLAKVEIEEER